MTYKPKRSLGQNFLVDAAYINKIVEAAGIADGDTVLEIGPGRGALTSGLRRRAARFVAIEKDDSLAESHRQSMVGDPTSAVVHGDALRVMPSDLPFDGPYRVVANLPYNMAARITMHLLEDWGADVRSMTLMFQAEVAERIVAHAGTASYGSLSVQIGSFCEGWRLFNVPGGAFRPIPKVVSSVVRLHRRSEPLHEAAGVPYETFRAVVRAGFQSRRKTLLNSLRLAPALPDDVALLEAALAEAGIATGARADAVPPEQFVRLSAILGSSVRAGAAPQSTVESDAD